MIKIFNDDYRENRASVKINASNNFPKAEHLKFAVDKSMEYTIDKAVDSVNRCVKYFNLNLIKLTCIL